MATVNFRLRKVNQKMYPVLVYLSLGRGKMVQLKTGFIISPKDWSTSSKRPKQNNEVNTKLFNDLKHLESFIYDRLNKVKSDGGIIDRNWLTETISLAFNRIESNKSDSSLLTTQIQYIIDNANTRRVKGSNKIGLSENRIKGYVTFLNTIIRYESFFKKQIRLTDINNVFVDGFTNWLVNIEEYSINYSGKHIDNLKTVCLDARKREIKTHPFVEKIQGFKDSKENKHIITLSFDELEQIRIKQLTNEYLINARKWLLIGCEIGQRGGDLLNLTKENIRYSNNTIFLDVHQQKTGKTVTIPITKNYIEEYLSKEFPHKITIQKLNKYFKILCKQCGIDESIKGKKYNKASKRKKVDFYPKFELITSHICRRSFSTNYYKLIPTPILIEITGHSKESLFLEYIGKPKDKDDNANLFLKLVKEIKKGKSNNLKAV